MRMVKALPVKALQKAAGWRCVWPLTACWLSKSKNSTRGGGLLNAELAVLISWS